MQIRRGHIIGLSFLAVVVFLVLTKVLSRSDSPGNAGDRAMQQPALPVDIYVVTNEILKNRILTTGSVLSNEEVELKSETSGRITDIYFREGKSVKQGELLVKINDAELQAELLKAEYRQKLAQDKEARGRKQLEIEAISQQDYDVIQNELNTIKAEMQLIRAQIAKTEIRAPFDGHVGLRYVSKGSLISQDSRIAHLLDLNPIKIDFTVPEKYGSLVHPGDRITFRVQGQDDEHAGEVYAVEPRIDAATRTLQLRARSDNPGGAILPGAFAEVNLHLEEIADALMIPTEALIPELGGQKIYLMRNGKAMPSNVEIGLRTEDRIQITAGLAPGDTVITSGILQLRPGLDVTVSGFEAS
jgi:membrane fusion protein (multidrug efflux system)